MSAEDRTSSTPPGTRWLPPLPADPAAGPSGSPLPANPHPDPSVSPLPADPAAGPSGSPRR